MRREPIVYDEKYLNNLIYNNNGVVGFSMVEEGKTKQDAVDDFIYGEIQFLGDTFMFDVNDVYYDVDPDVDNGISIVLKHDVFDKLKSYLDSLKK